MSLQEQLILKTSASHTWSDELVPSSSWKKAMGFNAGTNKLSDQPRSIIHTEQTMHSFLSPSPSLFLIFCLVICVDLFTGKTHTTEKNSRQTINPSWHLNMSLWVQFFQFPPWILYLNTQISQTVMATAFESVQCSHTSSISCIINLSAKIVHHILYDWHAWQVCNQVFFHLSP